MMYVTVKTALVNLLGDLAAGRFKVIGYQRQSKSADELQGNNKLVQVYYTEGDFPENLYPRQGDKGHNTNYDIVMSASSGAKVDLSVLDSDVTTSQQKAATLLAVQEAAEAADLLLDDLIGIVWNIITDARYIDLRLPVGDVSKPHIVSIKKDSMLDRGNLVVRTAAIRYSCRVSEATTGDTPIPGTKIYNSSVPVGDTAGAGVINTEV